MALGGCAEMKSRTPIWLYLAVLLLPIVCMPLAAQTATASALKAAFLYNFVKFTQWPVDALHPGERLSLCVVGDQAVAAALERTVETGGIDGHQLSVEVVGPDGPFRTCHLLYVSNLDGKRTGQLLGVVRTATAFTVSDAERFAEMGGVAQLIQENNRLRFAVNVDAMQRAHLKISSRLLTLAEIVKDGQPSSGR
jgi:hypothetical protein